MRRQSVELDLFSDAPTSGPWTVDVRDAATLQGGSPELKLSLDRTSGRNGDKIHVAINPTRQDRLGVEVFIVTSTLNAQSHHWFGVVGN